VHERWQHIEKEGGVAGRKGYATPERHRVITLQANEIIPYGVQWQTVDWH
jgi:hypothetical protein